jgi:hypothetical protein
MQHLNGEELARLVDEEPTGEEAGHLESCALCRGELESIRDTTLALGELPDVEGTASGWELLEAKLAEEGLLRSHRSSALSFLPRIAAALLLFAAGGVTGALARGGESAGVAAEAPPATTAVEASAQLRAAELRYRMALSRYAELSGADATTDPVNRLAALEGIVLTTRAALKDSPADPVINGYHLAALGQRDALLRQISAVEHTQQEQPWY